MLAYWVQIAKSMVGLSNRRKRKGKWYWKVTIFGSEEILSWSMLSPKHVLELSESSPEDKGVTPYKCRDRPIRGKHLHRSNFITNISPQKHGRSCCQNYLESLMLLSESVWGLNHYLVFELSESFAEDEQNMPNKMPRRRPIPEWKLQHRSNFITNISPQKHWLVILLEFLELAP